MAKTISKTLVSSLMQWVAEYYNIDVEDMIHGDSRRKFSEPRHVAMYLLHELLGLNKYELGEMFGRTRLLVHYAVGKVGGCVAEPRYNRRVAACVETVLDNFKKMKRHGHQPKRNK